MEGEFVVDWATPEEAEANGKKYGVMVRPFKDGKGAEGPGEFLDCDNASKFGHELVSKAQLMVCSDCKEGHPDREMFGAFPANIACPVHAVPKDL